MPQQEIDRAIFLAWCGKLSFIFLLDGGTAIWTLTPSEHPFPFSIFEILKARIFSTCLKETDSCNYRVCTFRLTGPLPFTEIPIWCKINKPTQSYELLLSTFPPSVALYYFWRETIMSHRRILFPNVTAPNTVLTFMNKTREGNQLETGWTEMNSDLIRNTNTRLLLFLHKYKHHYQKSQQTTMHYIN